MLASFQRFRVQTVRKCVSGRVLSTATPKYSKDPNKPFDKILIANRGEIACRIIKTARKLGVKTVAVYSEADAAGMHVRMADEAYCIGGNASKDSYLRMDRIISVAQQTGAQAIHPGYGFLSENSHFVGLLEKAGIVFIGPSAYSMDKMGDKIHSKIVAKNANCFTIPGFDGEIADADAAIKIAHEVGYPIMIKASAGGGGKGMRVAYNDKEAREGFNLSKSEALNFFGDDRMLIEKFIEDPHHIEIQVLADSFGNVVAFPERECSVQRRNQKVVEESPSCLLTEKTRKAMQEQAIALCRAVNYRSAGTIEMLADGKQNFYFLEMNTRLQVEHPVTEMVSGEDLVEHMLWVAAGKPLPARLTSEPCRTAQGWAIESRVYSEDPLRKFLPSIGPLTIYKQPPLNSDPSAGPLVRLDTGVFEGGEISMHYDPMIAKLITHASTRKEAIDAMEVALDKYVVQGLVNNINFLRSVYRNKMFRMGTYGTKFIPEQYPTGFHGVELTKAETNELLAMAISVELSRAHQIATADDYKYASHAESEEEEPRHFIAVLGGPTGKAYRVAVLTDDAGVSMEIEPYVSGKPPAPGTGDLLKLVSFEWTVGTPLATTTFSCTEDGPNGPGGCDFSRSLQYEGRSANGGYLLRHLGSQQEVIVRQEHEHELYSHMIEPEVRDVSKYLLSPMPGKLISLSVKVGDHVEEGQQLAIVEAMKMQNILRAEKAGVVKAIKCAEGAPLKVDQILIEFTF